ncbi:MAG: long-chain fatty acid--CoA ligase, partial [Prolixibacteraceae bacterium]
MTAAQTILLNGQLISSSDIVQITAEKLAVTSTPEWEKELFLFLADWFSDSNFIPAQTSGSTGEPKTIELPKRVMQKSAERTIGYFG